MSKINKYPLSNLITDLALTRQQLVTQEEKFKKNAPSLINTIFMSKSEKIVTSTEKKEVINYIKAKQQDIEEIESEIIDCSTFDFDTIVNFIIKVLSSIEGTKISKTSIIFPMNNFFNNVCDPYNIDFNIHTVTYIGEQEKLADLNSDYFYKNDFDTNDNLIHIPTEDKLTLLDIESLEIKRNLISTYPYLEEILNDLISFKYIYPEILEHQTLDYFLESLEFFYPHLFKKPSTKVKTN